MIPLPYLTGALAISLAANAFLGWQWAGAKAECRADMERAAKIATERERERASKADEEAVGIDVTTSAATAAASRKAQGNTHAREQAIRSVGTTGECRMPRGLPRLDSAVDEANAAAGI
jgi:Flp pilus assembly protein TadB